MHITISAPIALPNTAPSKPVTLQGNYIATAQRNSHPLAYDLIEANAGWVATSGRIASVFIAVDRNGGATIS